MLRTIERARALWSGKERMAEELKETRERLELAERGADIATSLVSTLHPCGSSMAAKWQYVADRGEADISTMAEDIISGYRKLEDATKSVFESAELGSGGKDRALARYGLHWSDPFAEELAAVRSASPEQDAERDLLCKIQDLERLAAKLEELLPEKEMRLYGRTVLKRSLDADPCGGWDFVLEPLGLAQGCTISWCWDGSGSLKDPAGERLAEWDLQTKEVDLIDKSGLKHSLTNPYEVGGTRICENPRLLLATIERRTLAARPELEAELTRPAADEGGRPAEPAQEELSDDELAKLVTQHPVYRPDERIDGKAWVTTKICQMGGCEYEGAEFGTYREALLYAARREAQGLDARAGCCSRCYAEYMEDCI